MGVCIGAADWEKLRDKAIVPEPQQLSYNRSGSAKQYDMVGQWRPGSVMYWDPVSHGVKVKGI